MSKSTIDLILLISFLLLVFLSFIAGLVGLLKGIYKTTLKTVLKLVLIIVLVFSSSSISTWIGNIDIGKIIPNSEGSMTILSYLVNYLNSTGYVSPMNGLSLYETTIAIATSALAFVTFIVGMILVQLTISLITAIFYHGIFRWFLPVETKAERKARKKKDNKSAITSGLLDKNGKVTANSRKTLPLLRVPGGLLGFAQEFIFLCLLISPLTALARIAVNNKESVQEGLKTAGVSEANIETANTVMDSAENSLIYKTLGLKNFDLLVMNKVSTVDLNNSQVSFSGLVSSTLDIAEPLLKDGIITYDQAASTVTINFSLLLSTTTVDALISNVIDSPMVMALIPPLVDVALNSVNGASFAIDELDFNNIDWSSELTILNGIYKEVYSSAIEPMVSTSGVNPKNFIIKTSTMTDDEMNVYVDAVSKLGTMTSVKNNLPVILSGIGRYLDNQGFEILPSDKSAYKDIDWSQDLKVFTEGVLQYFRTIGLDISSDINLNLLQEKTFDAMKDETKRNTIRDIICGQTNHQGLLDTQLFSTLSLSKIISSTLSSIPSVKKYTTAMSFDFLDSFSGNELKSEFSTMFSIAGTVFDEDSKINVNNLSSIDIGDSETASELADLLHDSKSSKIFSKLYPSIMKGILFNSNINVSSYLYGLTPYNFNYDSTTYIDDFESILRMMPDIKKMQELFTSSDPISDKIKKLDTDLLRNLMNLLVNSDFFNSDQKTGVNSSEQKNVNIATFFENLFKEEPFVSMNLVAPSIDDLQDVNWGTGVGGDGGEIDLICKMLEEGKKNADFLTDYSFDKIEDTKAFGSMIKYGFESKILSPSILSIIDDSLSKYLDDIGIPYSFNEMRNAMWIDDSDDIAELLSLLKGVDLKKIDLNTFSPDRLNSLLTVMHNMNLIQTGNTEKDPFGYALYSLIKKQGLFTELGTDIDYHVFELDDTNDWSVETGEISFDGDTVHEVTTEGQIAYFTDFFRQTQAVGFDTLKKGKIPKGFVSSIDESMNSSVLRNLVVNVFMNSVKNISVPEGYEKMIDSLDLDVMLELDHDSFVDELQIFEDIYILSEEKIGEDSKLDLMLTKFYTLSSVDVGNGRTLEDDMDDLLTEVSKSHVFTTKKEGSVLSPISHLFYSILDRMKFLKKASLEENDLYVKDSVYGILNSVDDWEDESVKIQVVINKMQGLSDDALSLVGSKLTKEQGLNLFKSMNQSQIFHRIPISLFMKGFTQKNIDGFLKDPDTNTVTHPLNFYVHLSASNEDIAYWDNEITYGMEMTLGEDGLKEVFTNKDLKIDDVKFDTVNAKVLYYIGKMHLFDESRSYLFYNMIDLYSTDKFSAPSLFLTGVDVPYGFNEKVYRFENLFFQNPKLLNENGELDETKAFKDLELVNAIMHSALEIAPSAINSDSLKDVDVDFVDLTQDCYSLTDSVFYRSDLASEIMAGIETQMMKNEKYAAYFSLLADTDYYADSYHLVNLVEARALNGFLALSKLESDKFASTIPYFSKSKLASPFSLFGEADLNNITDYKEYYEYFLTYSEYSLTHNSILALKELSVLEKIPVLSKDETTVSALSDFVTESTADVAFSEYLATAEIK